MQPGQDADRWPLADDPDADLAVASQLGTSSIRLYYVSGGRVVEGRYKDGRWDAAQGLGWRNETVVGGDGVGGGGGLSMGGKIGVGIGVGVGVLVIVAAVVCVVKMRRAQAAAGAGAGAGVPGGEMGGPWMGSPEVGKGQVWMPSPPQGSVQEGVVWGQGGPVYRTSGMSQMPVQWEGDLKTVPTTPPPRELESMTLASELQTRTRFTELP